MATNPLKKLATYGQAIWLDYIRRDLITSGKLEHLVKDDGLRGMTSNPSIFEKAIAESDDYQKEIIALTKKNMDVNGVYEMLTQHDVAAAADKFRPLYDELDGKDGYVSLEVNPHLAHNTRGTIQEARRLWKAVCRPNVFIKVPATIEGLPAIQQLISEGININVTLLFSLTRYRAVADAYMAGMEARAVKTTLKHPIVSVASFFLSRIDTLVDPILEKIIAQGGKQAPLAKEILGQTAIASAKIAYEIFQGIVNGDRFKKLAAQQVMPQRLLWASTSTKNPAYSDVKYVDALVGPETVNTVPMETLDAYRDHGDPQDRLQKNVDKAHWVFQQLPQLGIDMDKITQQLEDEGVEKFNKSYDELINTLEKKLKGIR